MKQQDIENLFKQVTDFEVLLIERIDDANKSIDKAVSKLYNKYVNTKHKFKKPILNIVLQKTLLKEFGSICPETDSTTIHYFEGGDYETSPDMCSVDAQIIYDFEKFVETKILESEKLFIKYKMAIEADEKEKEAKDYNLFLELKSRFEKP